MGEDLTDERVIRALAHPLRREILLIFDEGEASAKEIADRLGLSVPRVSYHVTVLRDLGLLELQRTTRIRGAHQYHYATVPRRALSAKAGGSLPGQARAAAARADWGLVARAANDPDAVLQAREVRLDAKGQADLLTALEKLWSQLDRLQKSSERRRQGSEQPTPIVVGVVAGQPVDTAKRSRRR